MNIESVWFDEYVNHSCENTIKKIENVIRQVKGSPKLPETIAVLCNYNFFNRLMCKMKFKLKRKWREERKSTTMSKSEWMASQGLWKDYL